MKIAYNPKTAAVITAATAANDDILFDLNARKVWAKGLRMGADWADISSKPSSLKNPYAIKFRDINGNEVSYDGSSAKDLTTGTYIAKLPYGFSSWRDGVTWGNTTGTSIASWNDSSGGSIDFRKDNPSSGKLSIKVDGRVYVNEGVNPVLSAESNNGFWGMRTPDGGNDWIRTPNSGLIPYVQGNAGSGHSSLGTRSWYFSTAYIDKVYGSLKGNADTATTATKATNAENADKLDGWHKDNIQWTGYITSGTADLQSYWFKIYDVTITNSYANDVTITFLVSDGFGGNFSIFYLKVRQNGSNGSGAYNLDVTLKELVGNLKNKIVAYYNDKTGNVQLWGDVGSRWGVLNYTILKKTFRTNIDFITLGTLTAKDFTSVQTQPTTDYTKVTMSRVGQVQYAESSSFSTQATKLQTARNLWGNSFDGTKDINGSIVFPGITDTAISNKISWNGSTDGADIYYQTTAKDQGNLVLNVRDDTNAYIQLALNGTFKSHFDVANSYWTGRSALADKWTTARTFTIGNTAKNVDGSGNVSWSLSEIGVRDTWRTVQVNSTSIGNNTLNLCGSTYIGLTNVNGKVTFSLVGSGTTANQAILSNGTANGWTLKTLNIDNWNTAYNFVSTITGTDTDNVINKWDEIVNFLAGITEDNKLNTLLNSKLSIQQLSAKDILTTKTNNALFWVDTIGTAGSITTGPFTDHPYALLSVTNCNQTTKDGKYFYRSRLAFNSVGDLKVASCHYERKEGQDDTWYNVLTSKNSGISGSTIKLNGTSITVYSSDTADGRYVKKSGDTMTGSLNFANAVWNNVGDDVAIGDHNIAGCLGIKGLNAGPGLAFYNSSNTLLSKLVGTTSQFQRVSGNNVFNILDTSTTSINDNTITINGTSLTVSKSDHNHDGKYVKIWGNVEADFNFPDGEGHSGVYMCHTIKTQSNKPYDYGLLTDFSTGNGHLQFFGASSNTIYTRTYWWTTQNNFKYTNWKILLHNGNSYVKDGKGVINGSTITLVDKATIASKVTNSLTLRANGTTLATYDGSSAKEANFTYANVGAASASHNHDGRYVRRWNGVYGSANKFLKLVISDEKGWVRLEVSDSNNALTAGYGIYMIGWSQHGQDNTDKLIVNCLYANDSRYTTALKVVRTSRNNYDFYFQFASGSSYPSYTINYGISIDSIDYTVTEVSTIPTATWTSSLVALQLNASSATSATKVIVNQHTTNDVNYPLVWSNQSNTSNVTENQLYKSWQDLHYNPKNKRLFVGGSVSTAYINATGTVTSAGFKHSAVTKNANQYVLTADGGYTFLNQTSNELAHEFDVNITVTSEWTDIEDFYGGNQGFLTQPGTYIVQVYYKDASADGMYEGYFSGIMSWYTGKTNSNNADEIVLHRVGHAYANTIYLRTRESLSSEANPYTKLQISANSDLKQHTYKFKFKRIC